MVTSHNMVHGVILQHAVSTWFCSALFHCGYIIRSHLMYFLIYLGLYSLSGKTSYRKISWSLDAARFGFKLFQSLWNLTGTSAALRPRCLSNFRAIRPLQHPISWLRDFTRFGGKTSYRLVNRGPGVLFDSSCVILGTYWLYKHIFKIWLDWMGWNIFNITQRVETAHCKVDANDTPNLGLSFLTSNTRLGPSANWPMCSPHRWH